MTTAVPTLLITDDDRGFRETLDDIFAPQGFHTVLAGDGEEALHIVQTQEVHLALLDVHMPRLTGVETLQQLKQFKAMLPCILMSARWDEQLIKQAQLAHAFLLLSKPFSLQQLSKAVWEALQRTYHWQANN